MKKLIPLVLALLLILASCSAGDAAPSPLPTAPLKVWDEANPVAVTISTRELTGEAKEIFDAMSNALSGETLLLNYESDGAQSVQVRVYELRGGVWELLSPAAAYALPDEDGSLALTLEPCFASGWALGIFDGSGGRWEGEAGPDISDCYTCITVGGEAMTAENIPVAIQVYDEFDPKTDSGKVVSLDVADFFDPASLMEYDAVYAVTLAFEGEPHTGYVDPVYQ